jgi:hypothetical protein
MQNDAPSRIRLVVDNDAPLRLARAAELAFPDGGMTASGLRKEAAKGRLVIERIANKDYTTLAATADMRAACRIADPKPSRARRRAKLRCARLVAFERETADQRPKTGLLSRSGPERLEPVPRFAAKSLICLVGVRGFEPPTPSSRTMCATRLRYTPTSRPI